MGCSLVDKTIISNKGNKSNSHIAQNFKQKFVQYAQKEMNGSS